jgi:hypothetical protein
MLLRALVESDLTENEGPNEADATSGKDPSEASAERVGDQPTFSDLIRGQLDLQQVDYQDAVKQDAVKADAVKAEGVKADAVKAEGDEFETNFEIDSDRDTANGWQVIDDLVVEAQMNHPGVLIAQRNIEIARAGLVTAARRENPNFVLDVDTPVYDTNDPTELSTRITFPIGKSQERESRRCLANATLDRAHARYQDVLHQLGLAVRTAAIRVAYLEQRHEVERSLEAIARQIADSLAPDQIEGDPGANYVKHIEAKLDADEATQTQLATARELAVASANLGAEIGTPRDDQLRLSLDFASIPLSLPDLEQTLADSAYFSTQIAMAVAALHESEREYRLERSIRTDTEIGPLYDDRLGEDDDTIGARYQVDLPIHDVQRGPIAESRAKTSRRHAQVQLAQHVRESEIVAAHRELRSLVAEIDHYRDDPLEANEIQDSQSLRSVMTADKYLRIQQAIVGRQLDRLRLEYRFVLLKSQLTPGVSSASLIH